MGGLNPRSEEGAAILTKLSRDNVAQLVVLELAQPSMASRSNRDPISQVCIANTHLYSNKDCPDVKLWQTLHPGHPDVNVGEDSGPNVLPDVMSITHSHLLGSVYSSVLGEEPKFTNFTQQFQG